MAAAGRPPGPRPAWYRRLPPSLQRVAAASDRVSSLPLHAGPALAEAVSLLPAALRSEQLAAVEALAQRIADGVCGSLGVSQLRVRVEGQRQHDQRGELHGLYVPANGARADRHALWVGEAEGGQVGAFRNFLPTLPQGLWHHLH